MHTTIAAIRNHSPCAEGWRNAKRLNANSHPSDTLIPIRVVLSAVGLDDALWCLRAVEGHEKELRLFAASLARDVQHLMMDPQSHRAIDTAERYARGLAPEVELVAAHTGAMAAAEACRAHARPGNAIEAAALAAAFAAAGCASRESIGVEAWAVAADAAWASALSAGVDSGDILWMAALAADGTEERRAAFQAAGASPWVCAFAAARIAQGRRLAKLCTACERMPNTADRSGKALWLGHQGFAILSTARDQ